MGRLIKIMVVWLLPDSFIYQSRRNFFTISGPKLLGSFETRILQCSSPPFLKICPFLKAYCRRVLLESPCPPEASPCPGTGRDQRSARGENGCACRSTASVSARHSSTASIVT